MYTTLFKNGLVMPAQAGIQIFKVILLCVLYCTRPYLKMDCHASAGWHPELLIVEEFNHAYLRSIKETF